MIRQWWLLVLVLTAATLWCTASRQFWRADAAIYDTSLPRAAAPDDIAIVAVDDASLSQFGRWPWPRARHAALVRRLTEAGAAAIALDFIFSEPDSEHPLDDAALAAALRQAPVTVLPTIVDLTGTVPIEHPPIAPLAEAVTTVGHVHLELDRDGIARSVYLEEGMNGSQRPELMLALLEGAGVAGLRVPVERNPAPTSSAGVWRRDERILIPYIGAPGHFVQYAYADVVSGRVPSSALRGKWVLVGMTAQGSGDAYPTPVSGYSRAMPGIEINANILAALRAGTAIRPVPAAWVLLWSIVPLILGCIGFLRLTPRRSLVWTVLLWLGTLGASVAGLRFGHWWLPCAAPLIALAVAQPLWTWRRLESTQHFLEGELGRLADERFALVGRHRNDQDPQQQGDVLQARIEQLRHATSRVRELRRLLSDTVNLLPDATMVLDDEGRLILANAAGLELLGSADERSAAATRDALRNLIGVDFRHRPSIRAVELRLGAPPKDLLFRVIPFTKAVTEHLGTLISVVDISDLRSAQREREDVARFLSHDLKSPASSLLGLAQLQRDPSRALDREALADRLDALAQRTLDLLDGFIAVAHAESIDPTVFSEVDLRDVIQDAVDEVWPLAESRHIALKAGYPENPVSVRGDRSLLARALTNLLTNAVKYSPSHSEIAVRCVLSDARVCVSVVDAGSGISPEVEARLFQKFSRDPGHGKQGPPGAGLGLAFVRIVAEKHAGSVQFFRLPRGTRFDLELPMAPSA